MSNLKKQFKKVSENWLLIVLFVFVLLIFSGLSLFSTNLSIGKGMVASDMAMSPEIGYDTSYGRSNESFAPDVETRLIIKNASINLEIKNKHFSAAESEIKTILDGVDAYIINENVSESEKGLKRGYYNIRVDSKKLDYLSSQLRNIGKLKHFSESGTDITGTHTDLSYELSTEKQRLEKYTELYNSENIGYSEKIDLIDKMTYQERTVKYLEDRLSRLDEQIAYSTININLVGTSDYVNISFFKFSELVKTIVNSINSLFFILFAVLPYAIAVYLIILLIRLKKKKSNKK
jgi:hypothetical protein